ncbi:MAG: nucleotidyltransferase, partial [Planctomycetes bacterium]|nr:nucleotidyltransferase [Planctomycetota bacterium]
MVTLAQALEAIQRIRPSLQARGVIRIGVFGSVARGTAREGSDVDCLVELADDRSLIDLIAVKRMLAAELGCPVDAVSPRGLKP